MNKTALAPQAKTTGLMPPSQGMLQRKCACGSHSMVGGECEECTKKKSMLQRKLSIGASNDPLEQEADRVADQVIAIPVNPTLNNVPPRIQRFAGQPAGQTDLVPDSVDHALASPGRPLELSLRQDMEQRFGNDFSQVRVHTGAVAEQSARDVNALAYTVGKNIVFGINRFAPESNDGRRLIAHELAHVVQQRGRPPCVQRQHARHAQAFDSGYQLYLNPSGTRYSRSTGRYDLSDWDLAHLVRRGGFYFIVTEQISLITPPEVRRAAPVGAPGSGVLLPITAADYSAVSADPDATVVRIVRDRLGIAVPQMTHATGADRDFSRPEFPEPMARALQGHGSETGAVSRRQAVGIEQEPTLEIAARRGGDLPIHEIGWSDRMSQDTILQEMSAGARAEWYVQKLGRYQAQIYASAQRHHIPTQLLAVVILNELSDINIIDVAQSGVGAQSGSLGIAQIQVTTAMAENLVDVSPAEAEAAYRQQLRRIGHDHDSSRPLTDWERQVGRRLRIGRQLQVPQVAIEAAAREIEILINRMAANLESPWQRRFNFRARGTAGDAIYNAVGPPHATQETREGMLAMMVSGAYNSPNVIDTGNPQGFSNALVHGTNAQSHAIQLHRLGLFRTAGAPLHQPARSSGATSSRRMAGPIQPVTGMRFDGTRLTIYGGAAASMFVAVSGLRSNNPHNPDHRDHTDPGSQTIPDVGPIPEGAYFINPSQVQRIGFNTSVWGPLRVPIHEEILTELARRWRTSRTGGFFVHEDVGHDGTAGCIGLQQRADTLAVFARFGATTDQIPLEVRYPRTGGRSRRERS